MAPLVWLAEISWGEAQTLMGTKTVLNELVAYLDLARLPKDALSERSTVIGPMRCAGSRTSAAWGS